FCLNFTTLLLYPMRYPFLLLLLTLAACCSTNYTEIIRNPLLDRGADPWVITDGDSLRYCYVRKDTVFLKSARYLSGLKTATERIIWTPPMATPYSREIWAPELHHLKNRWYVYVAADDGQNENHRMYVLQSEDATANSPFKFIGKIGDGSDKWAIDGTVLQLGSKNYFIWSGWEGDTNVEQSLYIAEMADPLRLSTERVRISKPDIDWERRSSSKDLPTINEGPQVLQRNGRTFIIYAAAGSWSDHYCLGMLELAGNNPLEASAWKKNPEPVFASTQKLTSP